LFFYCILERTVPKSHIKTNNATMSEHLQSPIQNQ
jgi:hypothetical protein